ncbi:MAG: hypothetical protein EB084_11885 [Proteobacteria bacterium]|nr:hypothetical protein [Pseudomonadota bacterium]
MSFAMSDIDNKSPGRYGFEIARSFAIFRYLDAMPKEAQDFMRRRMREVLKRDRIMTETQLKELSRHRALEFQRRDNAFNETSESWEGRLSEAKKQLTDLYFGANYSLDYLKYLVAENASELESAFNLHFDNVLDFTANIEKADIDVLIRRMFAYENLSVEEKARFSPEAHELRIVLITRLISEQPEFVRVAHKYLSITDLHRIYDRIIGSGKVGGKSAGMLLAYRMLMTPAEDDPYDFSKYFAIPESWYVGDDVFHAYLDYNGVLSRRTQKFKEMQAIEDDYPELHAQLVDGDFPLAVWEKLRQTFLPLAGKPLIVRSSSLLEDNFGLSFAGKYDSYFLPNQGTPDENMVALGDAIRKIYAGVFHPNALAYRKRNEIIYRYESMAILVQQVEGKRVGRYFLPDLAGVIFSENPYCWSRRIKKEDGMLRLVMGLGTRAVERVGEDYPRIVALGQPTLRPEEQGNIEKYSQKYVDVIDIDRNELITVPLSEVLGADVLPQHRFLLSCRKDGAVREPLTLIDLTPASSIITFDKLLRQTLFPKVLRAALEKIRKAYGIELDLEMAAEVDGDGGFRVTLLQCRPQSLRAEEVAPTLPEVPTEDLVFQCVKEVPTGRVKDVEFLVYVTEAYGRITADADRFEVARIIGRVNQQLEGRQAILIGPGRWGSSNLRLGVPVKYWEINNFRMLGEVARSVNGAVPELSFGTHFFQDLVESGIYCVPIYPGETGAVFNEAFLLDEPSALERFVGSDAAGAYGEIVRVLEVGPGRVLQVLLNGRAERGVCYVERKDSAVQRAEPRQGRDE